MTYRSTPIETPENNPRLVLNLQTGRLDFTGPRAEINASIPKITRSALSHLQAKVFRCRAPSALILVVMGALLFWLASEGIIGTLGVILGGIIALVASAVPIWKYGKEGNHYASQVLLLDSTVSLIPIWLDTLVG